MGLINDPRGAVRISLADEITAEVVRMMADPTGPQPQKGLTALSIARIDQDTAPGAAELGAIEIAKLSRLLPATVVATIPKAKLSYLSSWAESESLLAVELEAIRLSRSSEARTLKNVSEAEVPLSESETTKIMAFRPPDGGREHLAIVIGELNTEQAVLVRIHSECFLSLIHI